MVSAETPHSNLPGDEDPSIPVHSSLGPEKNVLQSKRSCGRVDFKSFHHTQNGINGSKAAADGERIVEKIPADNHREERPRPCSSNEAGTTSTRPDPTTKDNSNSQTATSDKGSNRITSSVNESTTIATTSGPEDLVLHTHHETKLPSPENTPRSPNQNHHTSPQNLSAPSDTRSLTHSNKAPAHEAFTPTSSKMLNHSDSATLDSIPTATTTSSGGTQVMDTTNTIPLSPSPDGNLCNPSSMPSLTTEKQQVAAPDKPISTQRPLEAPPCLATPMNGAPNLSEAPTMDGNGEVACPQNRVLLTAPSQGVTTSSLSKSPATSPFPAQVPVAAPPREPQAGGSTLIWHSHELAAAGGNEGVVPSGPAVRSRGSAAIDNEKKTVPARDGVESVITTKTLPIAFVSALEPRDSATGSLKRKTSFGGTEAITEALPAQAHETNVDRRHIRGDLPLGLRNKKMKPTDCLLFAATLLAEDGKQSTANGKAESASQVHYLAPAIGREDTDTKMPDPRTLASVAAQIPVPPKDIPDSYTKPREVDVLCGRGGLINKHSGNIVYRKVVDYNKLFYQSVHKKHRILVSQSIVQSILNLGGRFLIMGAKGKPWVEIGYKRAVQKTSQALRERSANQDDDQETKEYEGSEGEEPEGEYSEQEDEDEPEQTDAHYQDNDTGHLLAV